LPPAAASAPPPPPDPLPRLQWANYFSYISKTITDGDGGSIITLNDIFLLRDIGAMNAGSHFDSVTIDLKEGKFKIEGGGDEWWIL
jgi:hypothetical protein